MSNHERFWEASIAEAVTGRNPPDQTAVILARMTAPPKAAPRRMRWLRYPAELAAAAALVLAIAWVTGVFTPPPESPAPDAKWWAAPGAVVHEREGELVLESGMLLCATGAPRVVSGSSVFEKLDGLALLSAGSEPTAAELAAVQDWVSDKLEEAMLKQAGKWAAGATLAVLMLQGSATLDGRKIEAQAPASAEWHVVRSVMDIDQLPKGAKYVDASGLAAAHLEFLVEVPSLEAIRLRDGKDLRSEHLSSLKALKRLQWLDIRDVQWAHEPDLAPLTELPGLKRLGVDLIPAVYLEGNRVHRAFHRGSSGEGYVESRSPNQSGANILPYTMRDSVFEPLKKLSAAGVTLELGRWNPPSVEELQSVVEALPTLAGISLFAPTTAEMKVISGCPKLESLEIEYYDAGQIGLAYLARNASLTALSIQAGYLKVDELYQVARMGLRTLRIVGRFADSPVNSFAQLAKLKDLRELELTGLQLGDNWMDALKPMAAIKPLERLVIGHSFIEGDQNSERYGTALLLGCFIPAKRLELRREYVELPYVESLLNAEALQQMKAAEHVEEIRFALTGSDAYFERDDTPHQDVALKRYPNLKRIEVRRGGFREPDKEDRFVAWLREKFPNVTVEVTP
ncbi:MAG: hypothetical protein KF696_07625 [Planctomycetes bacterium]|nr:hypothetical protein [Planctomycetota bacterium]MCW8135421.1 hypothetical protein [Planctomycetota bacterium]